MSRMLVLLQSLKGLYREHYKAMLTACLAATTSLSGGAAPVNGQGEPVVALAMVALSIVFALLTVVVWKGLPSRAITWVVRIGGLAGFVIWSAFLTFIIWRNKPKDKWTNFRWDDVVTVQSYTTDFFLVRWRWLAVIGGLAIVFLIGRWTKHRGDSGGGLQFKGTGTVSDPCRYESVHKIADTDKEEIQHRVKVFVIYCEPHLGSDIPEAYIDFRFAIFNIAIFPVSIVDPVKGYMTYIHKDDYDKRHRPKEGPRLEVENGLQVPGRGSKAITIRQFFSRDAAKYIVENSSRIEFWFHALEVRFSGDGISENSLYTGYTVTLNGKYHSYDDPVLCFGYDSVPTVKERLLEFRNTGGEILNNLKAHRVLDPYEHDAKEWGTAVKEYLVTNKLREAALFFDNPLIEERITILSGEATLTTKEAFRWLKARIMRLEAIIRKLNTG